MPAHVKPIKVLHLRSSPFLGSPEKLILGRLTFMNRNECEYLLGIFDEQDGEINDFSESAMNLDCPSLLLYDSIIFFPLNLLKLYRLLKNSQIHVICAHDYKSNMYGLFLGKLLNIPIISVHHGRTGADLKVRLYERLDNLVVQYYDAIICVSKKSHTEIFKQNNYKHINKFFIPNAVDISMIEKLSNKSAFKQLNICKNNERIVLYAGRLSKEKGIPYLIEAARTILSKRKDVMFFILGEGPERRAIEKMITDNNLNKYIHLFGFKRNIYPYYKAMDFLVLPSLTEGMPIVILEAFALSKPVIATKVGGIPEIVEHMNSGILVNVENALELSEAIEFLLNHPTDSIKMGINGFLSVKSKFNFKLQSERYLSVYNNVLQNNATH